MMTPITKFAADRAVRPSASPTWSSMAFRECYQRRAAARPSWRSRATSSTARSPSRSAVIPAARPLPRLDQEHRRPGDIEKLADLLVNAERPVRPARQPGLDLRAATRRRSSFVRTLNIPAYMNGAGRGTLPPGDPHHFHLTRRYAFDNADVIVIVGTPFDFRMGYGKRLPQGRDRGPDRHGLPHRRQEPRHRPRPRRRPGRDPGRGRRRPPRAASTTARQSRKAWLEELRAEEETATEKRLPRLMSDAAPIHPLPASRTRSTSSSPRTRSTSATAATSSRSPRGVVQPRSPGHWMDPGPLGTLGVGVRFAHGGQVRPARQGGGVPVRRRRVQPDRLGLRDAGPLRPAVHRGRRQQLAHEPDPLRPDRRSTARSAATSATSSATSSTTSSPRCSAATARRSASPSDIGPALRAGARRVRQAVADQRLGRPERVRARAP